MQDQENFDLTQQQEPQQSKPQTTPAEQPQGLIDEAKSSGGLLQGNKGLILAVIIVVIIAIVGITAFFSFGSSSSYQGMIKQVEQETVNSAP